MVVIQHENHVRCLLPSLRANARCRIPDEKVRLAGEILLISSRTGQLLNLSVVPDQMESYYSPQLLKRSETEEYILIGTGGETHGGALYAFDFKCWKRYCSSPVIRSNFKGRSSRDSFSASSSSTRSFPMITKV